MKNLNIILFMFRFSKLDRPTRALLAVAFLKYGIANYHYMLDILIINKV